MRAVLSDYELSMNIGCFVCFGQRSAREYQPFAADPRFNHLGGFDEGNDAFELDGVGVALKKHDFKKLDGEIKRDGGPSGTIGADDASDVGSEAWQQDVLGGARQASIAKSALLVEAKMAEKEAAAKLKELGSKASQEAHAEAERLRANVKRLEHEAEEAVKLAANHAVAEAKQAVTGGLSMAAGAVKRRSWFFGKAKAAGGGGAASSGPVGTIGGEGEEDGGAAGGSDAAALRSTGGAGFGPGPIERLRSGPSGTTGRDGGGGGGGGSEKSWSKLQQRLDDKKAKALRRPSGTASKLAGPSIGALAGGGGLRAGAAGGPLGTIGGVDEDGAQSQRSRQSQDDLFTGGGSEAGRLAGRLSARTEAQAEKAAGKRRASLGSSAARFVASTLFTTQEALEAREAAMDAKTGGPLNRPSASLVADLAGSQDKALLDLSLGPAATLDDDFDAKAAVERGVPGGAAVIADPNDLEAILGAHAHDVGNGSVPVKSSRSEWGGSSRGGSDRGSDRERGGKKRAKKESSSKDKDKKRKSSREPSAKDLARASAGLGGGGARLATIGDEDTSSAGEWATSGGEEAKREKSSSGRRRSSAGRSEEEKERKASKKSSRRNSARYESGEGGGGGGGERRSSRREPKSGGGPGEDLSALLAGMVAEDPAANEAEMEASFRRQRASRGPRALI